MKPWQAVLLGGLLILVAWGSLFITVLNQAQQTRQLLSIDNKLLAQQKQTLREQSRTITILNDKFDDLKRHDDCLFNLATQPNRSTAYIADAQTCTLSNSPIASPSARSPGTPPAAGRPAPTAPKPADNGQANQPPAPKTAPSPAPTALDKIPLAGRVFKAVGL